MIDWNDNTSNKDTRFQPFDIWFHWSSNIMCRFVILTCLVKLSASSNLLQCFFSSFIHSFFLFFFSFRLQWSYCATGTAIGVVSRVFGDSAHKKGDGFKTWIRLSARQPCWLPNNTRNWTTEEYKAIRYIIYSFEHSQLAAYAKKTSRKLTHLIFSSYYRKKWQQRRFKRHQQANGWSNRVQ